MKSGYMDDKCRYKVCIIPCIAIKRLIWGNTQNWADLLSYLFHIWILHLMHQKIYTECPTVTDVYLFIYFSFPGQTEGQEGFCVCGRQSLRAWEQYLIHLISSWELETKWNNIQQNFPQGSLSGVCLPVDAWVMQYTNLGILIILIITIFYRPSFFLDANYKVG